jgi:serine/threonine protein phosphatase PrpC/tetratricopeptide (TPR) repeat protein
MMQPEKTVFISYRRNVSAFIARAVFLDLRAKGWDVFMDVESIDSGEFESVILTQIAARTHFVLILTQGTLDRCTSEDDWLRREIELAIDLKRNVVPIVIGDFKMEQGQQFLTGKLSRLARFNAIDVPHTYFEAAMEKLTHRFLKPPTQPALTSPSPEQQQIAEERLRPLVEAPPPTRSELSAEEHFVRGLAQHDAKDMSGALAAYTKAIELNPQYYRPLYNRALLYHQQKQYDEAIADYGRAIGVRPDYAKAFDNRGVAWFEKGQTQLALQDYDRALAIQADYALAFLHRANVYRVLGDTAKAINNYQQYLALGGGSQYNNQMDVEEIIQHLQKPNQVQPSGVTGFLRKLFNTDTKDAPSTVLSAQPVVKSSPPLEPPLALHILGGSTRPLPAEKVVNVSNADPISWGMRSDIGMVYSNNQDYLYGFGAQTGTDDLIPGFGLFIIADGMGGHLDGEKASRLAVRSFASDILKSVYLPLFFRSDEDVERAPITESIIVGMQNANKKLVETISDGGTTLTVIVLNGDLAYIGHVGDSRIYLITKNNVEQLTRDHSLVQRLIELGQISPEDAENHPQNKVLYRALGQNESLEVDTLTRRLPPDSQLLLCTDGLWKFVKEADLSEIVQNSKDPQAACNKLVDLAITRNSSDNISVLIVRPFGF